MISVVVPVYNVEAYIEKCVMSVCNQTYRDLQIILVDDGSTDLSGHICDQMAKQDQRITVIHKRNGGLSSARNAGIDAASGQYIGFVDSDDYIAENMYEMLLSALQKNDADISICNRYYVSDNGKKNIRKNSIQQELVMDSETALRRMNDFKSFDMAAWDKLYKKSLFDKIRFPENRLSEDFYIMCKLFCGAKKIVYIPESLYFYRQREGSITKNTRINFDYMYAAKEQMEFVEKMYPSLTSEMRAAYASACMAVYDFHIKNNVKCEKKVYLSLKNEVKQNKKYLLASSSRVKKIQTILFIYMKPLYKVIFFMYFHMQ